MNSRSVRPALAAAFCLAATCAAAQTPRDLAAKELLAKLHNPDSVLEALHDKLSETQMGAEVAAFSRQEKIPLNYDLGIIFTGRNQKQDIIYHEETFIHRTLSGKQHIAICTEGN